MDQSPSTMHDSQKRPDLPYDGGSAPCRNGVAYTGRRDARSVMMLGLRGIPNIQGGVEKHVEMLALELVKLGWRVEVVGRRAYMTEGTETDWNGVQIRSLWSPRHVAFEALIHTFAGVGLAAIRRPDVVHIHAVGPSLAVPLARLAGLSVVVTHHGFDYDRQKWGRAARFMLRLGESLGMRYANRRIGISEDIVQTMHQRYDVPVAHIPNGVAVTRRSENRQVLAEFDLSPRRYVLMAARLVPEKRQTDLIRAFARRENKDVKLVVAGGADFESSYSAEVHELAKSVPGVVMTGFQTGERLDALFSNASLFVLPSSHEGMPIALLEAMAHGLPVLASDIQPNLALGLGSDEYFPLGDIEALTVALDAKLSNPPTEDDIAARILHTAQTYNWHHVADRTARIYAEAVERPWVRKAAKS